jgi:hypothetical protein
LNFKYAFEDSAKGISGFGDEQKEEEEVKEKDKSEEGKETDRP